MNPTYNNKPIICPECGANKIKLKLETMTRPECVKVAAYAAKKVLPIFEKECPTDNRVQSAIDIAGCISRVWEEKEKMNYLEKGAEYAAGGNTSTYPARTATAAMYVVKTCSESNFVYNAHMAIMWAAMAASPDLNGYNYDAVLPENWL